MEKEKLNFLDIVVSLFLPRKMTRFMNIKFFISLLIIIVAALLNVVTSNIHAEKDAENLINFPTKLLNIDDNVKVEDDNIIKVENNLVTATDSIFHYSEVVEETKIDITIVFDTSVESKNGTKDEPVSFTSFDFEGYLKQNKEQNTEYVLYVLTKDNFFYLYNLELDVNGNSSKESSLINVFETVVESNKTTYKYYLPKSEEELSINEYGQFDTNKWTRVVGADEKIDFTISNEEYTELAKTIKPTTRHLKNIINALYGTGYSYQVLSKNDIDVRTLNTSLKTFNKTFKNQIVLIDASYIKSNSLIFSLLLTLIFPLMLAFITWILSKGFYMKKFKQYFAIAALCFFDTSLVSLILCIWKSYLDVSFILLIIAALYYIVAVFRINTINPDGPNKPNNKKDNKQEIVEKKDVAIVG